MNQICILQLRVCHSIKEPFVLNSNSLFLFQINWIEFSSFLQSNVEKERDSVQSVIKKDQIVIGMFFNNWRMDTENL